MSDEPYVPMLDKRWCRKCCSPQPRATFKGFLCDKCAERCASGKTRWTFDAAGNVISKGQKAKTKTGAATPALNTTEETTK